MLMIVHQTEKRQHTSPTDILVRQLITASIVGYPALNRVLFVNGEGERLNGRSNMSWSQNLIRTLFTAKLAKELN